MDIERSGSVCNWLTFFFCQTMTTSHLTAIQVKKELLSLDKQSANFAYYESLWQQICSSETLDSQIVQATSVAELDQILRAANDVEWKSNESTALLRESLPYGVCFKIV